MQYFRIEYKDGRVVFDKAIKTINIYRKYDLSTRENIGTRVYIMDEDLYERDAKELHKVINGRVVAI